uniref:HAUS augmin-like complex, subunit 2 n=1 Tax=Xiphophorus couchianus TaxID=32473 RepID=A0A3B5LEC5_9TELE
MNPLSLWDLSPFSVTPAASLLSRCVSVGAASQDEIDSAFSEPSPVFSARLHEAEELMRKQKRLDEVRLAVIPLTISADEPPRLLLSPSGQKNEKLQLLGNHLQGVLREHKVLRQRLMRPLARTNLPVLAHLHASVVDSIRLMMDFIGCLEEKLRSTHNRTTRTDSLALLVSSVTDLEPQTVTRYSFAGCQC